MLVAVDPPARGFAKISDFFPGDLSKWNLGENFGFVKFKIFEWKLVFPLILRMISLKYSTRGFFWNCVGGISFSDKFGGIAGDFIFGVRHFRRGIHVGEFFPRFFFFLGESRGPKEKIFLWEKEGNEILKFSTSIFEVANFKNGLR